MKRVSSTAMDHVSARLEDAAVARLDVLAPLIAPLGSKPTRSMSVRACILIGLVVLEKEYLKEPK